ncbi:RNA polymerase sigma-54 factor [Desulfohalotomaculum tongense]|uniref:RNA polymerase factor sigma-54 n=1 Tax=Desulforadius tongensis TaxID=1216062 RepID=UPI00195ED0D6|nr:RNA polymerase factor sigma-54 [Desulforadius tongensis]MBM7853644.1 RNA polymerase sigma-54 factor [Desulforadius tongensis]
MRLDYGLNLEQSQKLVMTPELRQAIKILQMSAVELTQYVNEQLQQNPLLEFNEQGGTAGTEPSGEGKRDDEDKYDIDWQEYFQDSSDLGYPAREKEYASREYGFEAFTAKAPSLSEHLNFQLAISGCPKELQPVVAYLIDSLDHNGYLKAGEEETAQQLGISPEKVVQAIEVLQSLEPAGVGARTLEECLLLQMKYLGLEDRLLEQIIRSYLPHLARGRLDKISDALGVDVKQVQQAADKLKLLDPKPGRNFSNSDDTKYIVPDVLVEKIENEYIVLVNDISAPRVKVNNFYRQAVQKNNPEIDSSVRKYVQSKLNSALWLIRSIEQRRLTLYKVAQKLVERQRDFLDYGIRYLKPLNLKDIADEVKMHESTVSRAAANKYMQTPRGVFEMKFFFSTGIGHKGGTQVSTKSVKKLLQEIIAGEDPRKPLSDQKIADLMAQQGVKISRRTVTKYRDELGIPAAGKRKRY